MESIHSPIPSQERIAGAIASIPFLFFIPHLMEKRTEFTVDYMRQGFGLTLISLFISIISGIPFFGIFKIVDFGVFIITIYLIWNAWNGRKFVVPYLLEYTNKVIVTLGIGNFFVRK